MTHSGGSSPKDHDTTGPAAPLRKRFVLAGHSATLDPANHALRDDLADVELADRVFAPHYAAAARYIAVTAATVHAKPVLDAPVIDTVGAGVAIDVFDLSAGWAWVRTENAVGYTRIDGIRPQ